MTLEIAIIIYLALGVLVCAQECEFFFEPHEQSWAEKVDSAASWLVLVLIWPAVVVLRVVRWWRRRFWS